MTTVLMILAFAYGGWLLSVFAVMLWATAYDSCTALRRWWRRHTWAGRNLD